MEHPPERYILILLFAVGPIFLGTALDMPLLTVLWTGGLIAFLIISIPFVIVSIMKGHAKPDENLEKQIERVRATLGSLPPHANFIPVVPPTLNPIQPPRLPVPMPTPIDHLGHAPTIAIKRSTATKK